MTAREEASVLDPAPRARIVGATEGGTAHTELVVAVTALAIHYASYPQPCRFDLVIRGGEVRYVEAFVDPDEPVDSLATRLRDAGRPAGGSGDRAAPTHLVVIGPEPDPVQTAGYTYRIAIDPADPTRITVAHAPGSATDATSHVEVYRTLLRQVLEDPGRMVRDHPLLRGTDRDRVLVEFNDTERDFPHDMTLHALFRRQARRTPDNVAVSTDTDALTYRELDERSDRLAHFVTGRVGTGNSVIAVLAERSLALPVALFGILKAGCAYLPLDPQAPPRRLAELVRQSGAKLVLAQRALASDLDLAVPVSHLEDAGLYPEAPWAGPSPAGPDSRDVGSPDDLAYVIYTSGSTGLPKGVMVEHRSVVNRLAWMQRRYPLDRSDTLLQKTPTIFDVSVWELFWWTLNGARLHLLAPGMEPFPLALVDTVARHRVTALHFVPSMLNVFLAHLESSGDADRLATLRWVFASGESLPPQTVSSFGEILSGVRLVNLYGPTETTVDVSSYDCPPGPAAGRVPIGAPIDNSRCYVLRHGQPVPVGVFGTLHVAGVGVARGYLGDPVLTAERFRPEYGRPDGRMYDTGDVVRWLPSGDLEFLGREDLQIKIRGIRIDLLEIENVLLGAPGVVECAVRLDQPAPSLAVLRAAVVGPAGLSKDDLRAYVGERLPPYMVPSTYDRFDRLPRTPGGKVDRRSLGEATFIRAHGTRL